MIDKLLASLWDKVLIETIHQYSPDQIFIGDVHLFLFEKILEHVRYVFAGKMNMWEFGLIFDNFLKVHDRCLEKELAPSIVFLLSELLSIWIGPLLLLPIYFGETMSFSFIFMSVILKIIISQTQA